MGHADDHPALRCLRECNALVGAGWRNYEVYRATHKTVPKWSYGPALAMSEAVACARAVGGMPIGLLDEAVLVDAIAAWRPAKLIFRFDETLGRELLGRDVQEDLPWEWLHALPSWCVYVETGAFHGTILGFFVRVTIEPDGLETLDLVIINKPDAVDAGHLSIRSFSIPRAETFSASLAMLSTWEEGAAAPRKVTSDELEFLRTGVARLLNLVLYLCLPVEKLDYEPGVHPPHCPASKRDGNARKPIATSPSTYTVGLRIGADFRRQRAAWERSRAEHKGGTHASPVPHYRTWYFGHRWVGHGDNKTLERRFVSECYPNRYFEAPIATVRKVRCPDHATIEAEQAFAKTGS